jgi:hypothetical protein
VVKNPHLPFISSGASHVFAVKKIAVVTNYEFNKVDGKMAK